MPTATSATVDIAPPRRYALNHVVLHWTIAFLVMFQLIFGHDMAFAFARVRDTGILGTSLGAALMHGTLGSVILLLMVYRLYMRISQPIPPPAPDVPRAVQVAGRANHWVFYALLIAMPLAGLAAWFGRSDWLGDVHSIASKLLLLSIAAHLAGAIYHRFVRGDDIVRRMAPGSADATEGRSVGPTGLERQ